MVGKVHTPAQDGDIELAIARASRVWDEAVIPDWLDGSNAHLGGRARARSSSAAAVESRIVV
ncbi:hypothetical protein [Brachybacterium aquaticum]|uniref:Uncharacterized protein n=1 Tax=Brachybacterium aquaticum TaxID=1432564 RepID=A0A841AF71_9MICO|nr:hypothetical protein [Brachybacterium aquaticum]MBB5831920.1 hypothetical protein [Brachybacterium aquaticum]